MGGDITYGNGLSKSVDGGKTWQSLGLTDTRQIGAVVVDPKNPDIVLVAALGHAFGPNANAAFIARPMAARQGRRCLPTTTGPVLSTSTSIRTPKEIVLRRPVAGRAPAVEFLKRRRRQRALSLGRWRGVTWQRLSGGHGLPAGFLGTHRHLRLGRRFKASMLLGRGSGIDGGVYRSDDAGQHMEERER